MTPAEQAAAYWDQLTPEQKAHLLSLRTRRQKRNRERPQIQRTVAPYKAERNDRCPCGSGKKFKRCHLGQEIVQQKHRTVTEAA